MVLPFVGSRTWEVMLGLEFRGIVRGAIILCPSGPSGARIQKIPYARHSNHCLHEPEKAPQWNSCTVRQSSSWQLWVRSVVARRALETYDKQQYTGPPETAKAGASEATKPWL